MQDQLLKALKIEKYIRISMNEYKVDFVPEFVKKPYLSIVNPQSWDLEKNKIETIFRQVEKIRNILI